jgi:hypothetical protein
MEYSRPLRYTIAARVEGIASGQSSSHILTPPEGDPVVIADDREGGEAPQRVGSLQSSHTM